MSDVMDNVDKFIADISNTIDYLIDNIQWDFYEKKFNLEGSLGYHNHDGTFYHHNSIDWIINNAFNKNPKNCISMLEYICYKNSITFDFSDIKNEIDMSENEVDFEFPKRNLKNLRVFISYSSEDLIEAERIYNIFKDSEIHCFLASKEIKLGENWDERIFEELINADIFIFLLSEDYKNSFWCNQESSIGYLKREFSNSIVIPLLMDTVTPYGIFYKIQGINSKNIKEIKDFSKFINSNSISFDNAIELEYKIN